MAESRPSVTFTILIFVGMVIALVGLVILLMGLGGATTLEFSVAGAEVKTTSAGLGVLAAGCALSAVVALNLPANVQVFGPTPATPTERLRRLGMPLLVVCAVCIIALLISIMVR